MNITAQKDALTDGGVQKLLEKHLEEMKKYSPSESIHALDANTLKSKSLTFWSVRMDDKTVGCGALKELSRHAGEVKSMKTDNAYTRKGIAQKILSNIIAVALYLKHGFQECGPFGDYIEDPYSKYLRKDLEE